MEHNEQNIDSSIIEDARSYNKKKRIHQPKWLSVDLCDHQKVAVADMERLERKKMIEIKVISDTWYTCLQTNVGIHGDIPGYGKTLSMISLICRDKMKFDKNKKSITESFPSGKGTVLIKTKEVSPINTTLIVANQSLIGQWEKEFAKVDLKAVGMTLKTLISQKDIRETNVKNYSIILCSSTMYNALITKYNKKQRLWKRFIFDEPVSNPIPSMVPIEAEFTWLVTSTYELLERVYKCKRTNYLRDVVNNNSMLQAAVIKNPDEYVIGSFKLKEPIKYYHNCKKSEELKILEGVVPESVVKMIAADDYKGALLALGGIEGSETDIITLACTKLKKDLLTAYEATIKAKKEKNPAYKMLKANTKEVLNKYNLLKERLKQNIHAEECIICKDDIKNMVMLNCCNSTFCASCVVPWLQKNQTCPMCRKEAYINNLIYVNRDGEKTKEKESEKEKENKEKELPSKLQKVLSLIESSDKCLIYSSYDETFKNIKKQLDENNISNITIGGTKNQREKQIESYTTGPVKVLMLNSNQNGAGLNLQNTKDIIIYHNMPTATEKQIIGRGQRIGRKGTLKIHYFVEV